MTSAVETTVELKTPKANYAWPIVGDTFRALDDAYSMLRKRTDELGPVCVISQLGEKTVLLKNPATMRKLLQKEHILVESKWPYTIKTMFGEGAPATTQFEDHTKMRRLLAPAFSPKAVAGLLPRIQEIIGEELEGWAAKGTIKALDEGKLLSFKIAVEVILGTGEAWSDPATMAQLRKAFDAYSGAFFSLVPLGIPGSAWSKGQNGKAYLISKVSQHIQNIRNEDESAAKGSSEKSTEYRSAGHQIALLRDDDGVLMPLEKAANLLIAVMWAAHDTLACTFSLMLRSLKGSPEAVRKLREEQAQVVAEHGKTLAAELLGNMPFLDACVKECMRIDPAVIGLWREALEDLDIDGYLVKKGSTVGIYTGWAMRELDPRWADRKDELALAKFAPERWLTEEGKTQAGWMPFSGGPRLCIGYHFAMAEIKIFLALLARHYEWDCDSEEPLILIPLAHPKRALPTTFRKLST